MSETDLGGGSRLVLNDLSALAELPAVKAAVRAKAEHAASYANDIAITEDATYWVRTRNGVVGVLPHSYEAVVDDAYHSTLLKVLAREQGT